MTVTRYIAQSRVRALWRVGAACSAALFTVWNFGGVAAAPNGWPIRREILALYDGDEEHSIDATRIHRFAELPLNHLGFVVRYQDVRLALPDPSTIARYRGVLTWFTRPVPDSTRYLAWANQAADANVKLAILGEIGAAPNSDNLQLVNALLGRLGLRHTGEVISPTLGSRIVEKQAGLVEFECSLDPVLPDYPVIEAIDSLLRRGVYVRTPEHEGGRFSTLVAISDGGGFAATNYEFCHQHAPTHRGRWLINPFEFFRLTFQPDIFPIPDTTTLSGRRVYYGQLNSEGWGYRTEIERYRVRPTMAAEVVLRDIVERYRDLPLTLDLHDSDLKKPSSTTEQAHELAKAFLAAPQIERPGRFSLGTSLSRYDASYPSISSLSTLSSGAEPALYYTATSDETAYADHDQPYSAQFRAVGQTLRNTEWPRRLKAFNLNFHVAAGQRQSSLRVVTDLLDEARAAHLMPVATSRYGEIVNGFFTARIARLGSLSWMIDDRGALQTVRFDDAGQLSVDIAASRGVLGQTRHGASLYVALDEDINPATVTLRHFDRTEPEIDAVDASLTASSWQVRHLVREPCRVVFEADGFGSGEFVFSGVSSGAQQIVATRGDQELSRQTGTVGADGQLSFKLDIDARTPVVVAFSCREARSH